MFRSLRRHVNDTDAARLFGPASGDPIQQLVAVCGGQVRDLLRMMREVLTRANVLPVDGSVVERVIGVTRRDFLPIAVDDARLLHDISVKRNLEPVTLDENAIEHLSNFFNTHLVMYFDNGESWYDIHPLVRGEVEQFVADSERNE
jgi:hypothetical protein